MKYFAFIKAPNCTVQIEVFLLQLNQFLQERKFTAFYLFSGSSLL